MADDAKLPTEEEIAQLPRWARVAFAARCARRVLPLFRKHWPEAPTDLFDAVRRAVEVAEYTAAQAATSAAWRAARAAAAAANAANAAAAADAANSGIAAAHAVNAADIAAHAGASRSRNAVNVALAANIATQWAIPLICRDFQRLLDECRRLKWTDDTPVPPSVFGPLDESDEEPQAFTIEFFTSSGTNPHRVGKAVVKLWEVANEYHMARGGGVLTFDEFKQMIPALVPVGPEVGG